MSLNDPIANLITPVPTNPASGPTGRSAVDQSQNAEIKWLDSQFNGIFNVKAFGAKGDNSTDDTAAIQAAVNAAHEAGLAGAGGGVVFLPSGRYILSAPITLYNNIWFYGTETSRYGGCVLVPTTLNTDCLYMNVKDVRISNLIIQLINADQASTTSGYGINCYGCEYVTIENVGIDLMWGGVWFNNCSECGANGVGGAGLVGGPAIWLDGGMSFTLNNVGGSENYNSPGIQIDDCPTVNATGCGGVHCNPALQDNGGQFHYFYNFQADHCQSAAVILDTPEDVKFIGGLITSSGQTDYTNGHGIWATNVNQLAISDMTIVDNKDAGIMATGCSVFQVSGCGIAGNGDSGVNITNSGQMEFVGNFLGNNYGYGVNASGGGNSTVLIANNYMLGNQDGPVSLPAPGLIVKNNTGLNPVGVVSGVTAPTSAFTLTDSFARANSTSLGSNWTNITTGGGASFTGAPQIVSDLVECNGSGYSAALYTGTSWSNDQSASITLQALHTEGTVGVILRGSGPTTGFNGYQVVYWDNDGTGEVVVSRFDSGTPTTIAAFAPSVADGNVLTANIIGTLIAVYQNGTYVGSINDGTYGSGSPGIILEYTGTGTGALNNFSGTSFQSISPIAYDAIYNILTGGSTCECSVSSVQGSFSPVITIPATGTGSIYVPAGSALSLNYTSALASFTCQGL